MKNKKNVVLAVAILLGIVFLGIGYAAITTNLTVNGTAIAKVTNEFKVVYDGTNSGTTTDSVSGTSAVATAADDATSGTCEVTLATVNATGTCTFEFKNKSPQGINALVNASNLKVYSDSGFTTAWTASSDEYFDVAVTPAWSGTATLAPNGTNTFNVTVTLKKAYVNADSTATYTKAFYVRLEDITADQA